MMNENKFEKIMEEVFKARRYGEIKMRDPQRIDRILNLIAVIWRRNPDLRLGQLLYNYAGFQGLKGDIYNYEDDETEEKLIEYVSAIKRTGDS